MKRNCANCHFLSKEHRQERGEVIKFSLDQDERDNFSKDPVGFDRGWCSLACYMGVWDEGVTPVSPSEDKILFLQDRGYGCFFVPYRKSMLFPAAVELQKRSEENRLLRRAHKYTAIGLWIAGIGLILNGIVALYEATKC